MDIKCIKFEDYKCFKSGCINNIKPINVIIGKNNIGKSSILDIFEMLYSKRKFGNTKIILEKELTDEDILRVFGKSTSGGGIPTPYHYDFGKQFIGKTFPYEVYLSGSGISGRMYSDFSLHNDIYEDKYKSYWERLAISIKYKNKITKRILAERNIFPESENESMDVDGNGNGITTIISNFINKSQYDESLVREKLLNKLNEIMGEDATFTEIVTQQVKIGEINKWEIFLREEEKGRISLSDSGSGLKTILMVLAYTILIPNIEKKKLKEYIFMFEELENNLHPSLQRRLLKYIEDLTMEGCIFFLTTHSNVMLDTFQNNENVNALHVIKNPDKTVNIINATDGIQKNDILNDLGIKASDILQSNGVIWVEGPSDRIYINKWIDLWSNGKIKEGKHYQCVFYGGRLLSNVTLTEKEKNDLINLLNVNRNSIILIDSDKKNKQASINTTKKRIEEEANKNNILCWITKGREIENYVPEKLVKEIIGIPDSKETFGQYQNIEEFLNSVQEGLGNKFLKDKIGYAKTFTDNVHLNDYKESLDLNIRMTEVVKKIEQWNK